MATNKNIMVGILLAGLRSKTLVKSPYVKRYMPKSWHANLPKCSIYIKRTVFLTYSIRKNIADLFRGGFFALPLKLVLFNCLIIFIAFVSAKYIPESFDESKYWFQRSGAIVTLVTIWVEVKLVNNISKRTIFNEIFGLKQSINNHLPNFHTITIDENEMRDTTKEDITHFKAQTKNRANFFNAIIFINLITGTVIWAYGDLIYISFF